MNKILLETVKNNPVIQPLLQKPSSVSVEDEVILLNHLKNNNLSDFFECAFQFIAGSEDAFHLYTYLLYRLEAQGVSNEEMEDQVCERLFRVKKVGRLQVVDHVIFEYCKQNARDPYLLEEISEVELVDWFDEYAQYIHLEDYISKYSNIDVQVSLYWEYINQLLKEDKIYGSAFRPAKSFLQFATAIFENKHIVGYMISPELVEKLDFEDYNPELLGCSCIQ